MCVRKDSTFLTTGCLYPTQLLLNAWKQSLKPPKIALNMSCQRLEFIATLIPWFMIEILMRSSSLRNLMSLHSSPNLRPTLLDQPKLLRIVHTRSPCWMDTRLCAPRVSLWVRHWRSRGWGNTRYPLQPLVCLELTHKWWRWHRVVSCFMLPGSSITPWFSVELDRKSKRLNENF